MHLRRLAVFSLILTAWSTAVVPCRADWIVTVGNLSLAQGATGYVDVTIRSDAALGDPLNLASFQFAIDTLGVTRLEFVDPQPDPQLADAAYVFAGDSFDAAFSVPVGTVSTTIVPNDTFTGGDSTLSGSDVVVTTDRLMARLQVTAATALSPGMGDTFSIHLVPGLITSFESTGGVINYTSIDGTVTIVASPVPEPSAIVLLLMGVSTVAMWQLPLRR